MKLLSLAPSNTEILFALGLGDSVVGVTHFCDYPNEVKRKYKVGAWINTEPEKIKLLKPDLIFTSYFIPEPLRNWTGPGKLVHVEPKTLNEVFQSILHIGKTTRSYRKAKMIVDKMKKDFAQIKQSNNRPRIYMEEWFSPPMASGNWVPEIVELAGGIEGVAKRGEPSREFSFEELATFDPDIMVFHWCGWGERFDKRKVIARDGWKKLRAVRNDKLFAIGDALLNRPGPRLVEGARRLQKILQIPIRLILPLAYTRGSPKA